VLQSLSNQIIAELDSLTGCGRLRALPNLAGSSRVLVTGPGGESLLSFCSNDYLGLASHPAPTAAAHLAAAQSGFGAGASRLVAGDLPEHRSLEAALASLVRLPSALLFPTGYQANIGVITALAGTADLIVADRAVHASIIDACRLSRAKLAFYPHLKLEKAEHHLATLGGTARRRLLITESLFSMDGDFAPLAELADLAKTHDAALYVDEAHALGLFGPGGSGVCSQAQVVPDVLIGTLGKAVGSAGAFAAGSALLRDYLINRARTFIFTTALPPPVAAAALAAVRLIASPEGEDLRLRLSDNINNLRGHLGLPLQTIPSPIIPVILGTDAEAVQAAHSLRSRGLFVQAIRPPTVPEGTSRLRLTVSAAHTPSQIARLAEALSERPTARPAVGTHPPQTTHPFRPLPPSPPGLFLAGTDTGVGKTTVASAILTLLARKGIRAVPFKPVETGASEGPQDAIALRQAARRSDLPLDIVCPISFSAPIAPAAAAAQEGVQISLPTLLRHFRRAGAESSFIIVEAAGGLLTPYAPTITGADLAAAFQLPILLVARNALGTVNHTALALAEIRRRRLPLLGTILVDVDGPRSPDQGSNARLIEDITGIAPLGVLPHLPKCTLDELADQIEVSVDLSSIWALVAT
jgi:8-amino-7-oxononanoate synthase